MTYFKEGNAKNIEAAEDPKAMSSPPKAMSSPFLVHLDPG